MEPQSGQKPGSEVKYSVSTDIIARYFRKLLKTTEIESEVRSQNVKLG